MDNQNQTPNVINPNPVEQPAVTPNIVMPATAPEQAPAPVAPETAPGAMPAPVPGAPAAAGDVDEIEPVWVEKAENAIAAHINDPYGEEAAVEKLQEEYLQQRYGIKVADPNTGDVKPSGS